MGNDVTERALEEIRRRSQVMADAMHSVLGGSAVDRAAVPSAQATLAGGTSIPLGRARLSSREEETCQLEPGQSVTAPANDKATELELRGRITEALQELEEAVNLGGHADECDR